MSRAVSLEDPLAGVAKAATTMADALPSDGRSWLLDRVAELRCQWAELEFSCPPGLIHGDAHSNNLMRTADGAVLLGDWDHVAIGPREWDLMQLHHFVRRFGACQGKLMYREIKWYFPYVSTPPAAAASTTCAPAKCRACGGRALVIADPPRAVLAAPHGLLGGVEGVEGCAGDGLWRAEGERSRPGGKQNDVDLADHRGIGLPARHSST